MLESPDPARTAKPWLPVRKRWPLRRSYALECHAVARFSRSEAPFNSADREIPMRGQYPCDYAKACHILYCIHELGWTVTKTSIELKVNLGTVSRVARGLHFPDASPKPPPGFDEAA